MKTKGFTLVELLVVIAILAILATVSVVGYTSFIDRAEQSNAETELHQIETTINSYHIAGQKYAIATLTTGEGENATTTTYYAVVTDGVVTIANGTNVIKTAADLAKLDWADFEEVKAGFTVNTETGALSYKGLPVNLAD